MVIGSAAIITEIGLLFLDIEPKISTKNDINSFVKPEISERTNNWRVVLPRMRLTVPRCSPVGLYAKDFWKVEGSGTHKGTAQLVVEAQKLYPNVAFEYLYYFMDLEKGWGTNGDERNIHIAVQLSHLFSKICVL